MLLRWWSSCYLKGRESPAPPGDKSGIPTTEKQAAEEVAQAHLSYDAAARIAHLRGTVLHGAPSADDRSASRRRGCSPTSSCA